MTGAPPISLGRFSLLWQRTLRTRGRLAYACLMMGLVLLKAGDLKASLVHSKQAVEISEDLLSRDPTSVFSRVYLAEALGRMGERRKSAGGQSIARRRGVELL